MEAYAQVAPVGGAESTGTPGEPLTPPVKPGSIDWWITIAIGVAATVGLIVYCVNARKK